MPTLNKKSLSERDICSKFITPALVSAILENIHTMPKLLLDAIVSRHPHSKSAPPKPPAPPTT